MGGERKLFGTDGIRGKANVYPITGETAFLLGRAVSSYFEHTGRRNKRPLIIVGKDTRRSGYMIENAFSSGVCAQGGEVILTGPLPTPAVAFVTTSMRADAGVMISASHNDFDDNGIKIFDARGLKLPDLAEVELESLVFNPNLMEVKLSENLGSAKRLKEVFGRYLVHVKSALSPGLDLEGMRIVLDCAHGAAHKVGPMVFSELGAEVIPLGVSPNGVNINLKSGALHPEGAQEAVLKYRADLGICLDGDADRFLAIDEGGQTIEGDRLMGLFGKFLLEKGKISKGGTVVGTVMSNMGLENYLKNLGLNLVRTQVGDRYILEAMGKNKSPLGGEPSGHILFSEHSTTGDGILGALKFLECMGHYKKKASGLPMGVELFPQVLRSITVKRRPPIESVPSLVDALKNAETSLKGEGRVFLRYSGTGPLARVMVEGKRGEVVEEVCRGLVRVVEAELS